ncbi:MAG: hypothetical protein NC191_02780 [Muribaculaceae bacterium]|nr:hypothetical protein [Muribaculaceae bacterium]
MKNNYNIFKFQGELNQKAYIKVVIISYCIQTILVICYQLYPTSPIVRLIQIFFPEYLIYIIRLYIVFIASIKRLRNIKASGLYILLYPIFDIIFAIILCCFNNKDKALVSSFEDFGHTDTDEFELHVNKKSLLEKLQGFGTIIITAIIAIFLTIIPTANFILTHKYMVYLGIICALLSPFLNFEDEECKDLNLLQKCYYSLNRFTLILLYFLILNSYITATKPYENLFVSYTPQQIMRNLANECEKTYYYTDDIKECSANRINDYIEFYNEDSYQKIKKLPTIIKNREYNITEEELLEEAKKFPNVKDTENFINNCHNSGGKIRKFYDKSFACMKQENL